MVFLQAILNARTQNVASLIMPQDESWHMKIRCTHCNEHFPKQVKVNRNQQHEMVKDRKFFNYIIDGNANFVVKCKNCDRRCSINIDKDRSPYKVDTDEDGMIKGVIVVFECRGIEIEKVQIGNSMGVKVKNTGKVYQNADFTYLLNEIGTYGQSMTKIQGNQYKQKTQVQVQRL